MSMSDEKNFQEPTKVIGYWMSEKKSQKLNWTEFSSVCRKYGYKLVKLNLDIPLEEQGPFTIIVHKLTDIIVRNDEKAIKMIRHVEEYIERHGEVAVLDPLANVKKLLDRYSSYRAIRDSHLNKYGVFTPSFVELTSEDICTNLQRLKKAGVTFPFICKPSVSHGTKECHKMAVIFNEAGLKDCKPPCVAQSFVNHDALLFKVYILGEQYCVAERPSLKNFYPCDHETIFFDTHDVSKPDSTSSLSILEPHEEDQRQHVLLDPDKLKIIVHKLRNIIGMSLLGIDIVIENNTGRYAIIDINAYPGYDGYPNFFEHLMLCIQETVDNHKEQFLSKNKMKLNSPSLKRINVINNPPDSEYNNYNETVTENGRLKLIDNSNDESDNDDDILNRNKNNNTNCNNKNLIVNNEQNGDPLSNARSETLNSDEDKKCKQLQQHQRVRTVSGKKSVERQL